MLLGEPQRTAADVHFVLLGIPVRVHPFFWLLGIFLGMQIAKDGRPDLILLWLLALFISILVHEFGHAMAYRYYGISSHVVLYHFGGLAISDDVYSAYASQQSGHQRNQIVISAAGPVAQLLLATVVVALVRAAGYQLPISLPGYKAPIIFEFFSETWIVGSGLQTFNETLQAFIFYLLFPSVFWALLNLLPIYPLDGGQISRELFMVFNVQDGIRHSLILSIGTGILVAVYGLIHSSLFMAMMFGLLAYSSYQTLQAYTGGGGVGPGGFGGGGGFGGRRPW